MSEALSAVRRIDRVRHFYPPLGTRSGVKASESDGDVTLCDDHPRDPARILWNRFDLLQSQFPQPSVRNDETGQRQPEGFRCTSQVCVSESRKSSEGQRYKTHARGGRCHRRAPPATIRRRRNTTPRPRSASADPVATRPRGSAPVLARTPVDEPLSARGVPFAAALLAVPPSALSPPSVDSRVTVYS